MTALDLIHAHATRLSSHNSGVAAAVCDALGVDVDEGRYVSWHDVATLALTLHALAAHVARGIDDARDVPPVTLLDALREADGAEADVCPECDEAACFCWVYDDDLPAPVAVILNALRAVAHSIQAAQQRQRRAAS